MSSAKDELIPPPQKNIGILLVAARTVGFEVINDKVIERPKAEVVECFSPLRSVMQVKNEL
jgi:hypothetical protein